MKTYKSNEELIKYLISNNVFKKLNKYEIIIKSHLF